MSVDCDDVTLVVGGTGKTGRRVAARLSGRGLPVRIGARRAPVPFDWTDRSTWARALAGVGAAYVAYQPDLAVPGAAEDVAAFAGAARAAGVSRLVLLSGRGEEGALAAERALAASGVDWTVLRCSWFAQNFSEAFLREAVVSGVVALPVGDVPEPFVDAEDIADAAVEALVGGHPSGRVYELTGPRALTFSEAVDAIASATGRPIAFATVAPAEFRAGAERAGIPAPVAAFLADLFSTVLDGRNAATAHGVRDLLGRDAARFEDYARRTAAAGAWAR